MSAQRDTAALRGGRRRQLAQRLAVEFVTSGMSIRQLAEEIGRRPCTVRRLLVEAGVEDYTRSCLGPSEADVAARLAQRYRRGESVDELADATAIDRRELRRLLREAGVRLPSRTRRASDGQELARAYRAGDSIRQIAAARGLDYSTVRDRLLAAGVTLRHQGSTTR
ncbi:helix-turn-helix domain-containing protein [Saccharothrix hoggarensis]|uniref:Helix-turn-helix domain-containing protein n=1 Tax=Saccharothrix hoggarensis TaxID=913853 RepID=A0ABW3QMG1_9PSEU